jgi:hypothetical protein
MNKAVVLAHQGSKIPGRVINLNQARVRHGDKADHMVALANSEARRWQTFTPTSAGQALQENTAARLAHDRSPEISGGPTYQQYALTGTVGG